MAPTTAASDPSVGAGFDVGEAYGALSGRLEQIVRLDVRAPDVVIEDACQFAWSRLVRHSGRVRRESALSWLAKTAIHEAFKLIRRDGRELSLEIASEQLDELGIACGTTPGPAELFESRERLGLIRTLPERQQRLLWLYALGLGYVEIGQHTGCTPRTVERQLMRAKRTVRTLASQ